MSMANRDAGTGLLGRRHERAALVRLLAEARGGHSAVLVVRGEPGIGKTALLDYAVRQAAGFRTVRAAGAEAEMELPFAGLHQLCVPMLHRLPQLPPHSAAPWKSHLARTSGLSPIVSSSGWPR